jgi:sugar lactone lactonase YvrE
VAAEGIAAVVATTPPDSSAPAAPPAAVAPDQVVVAPATSSGSPATAPAGTGTVAAPDTGNGGSLPASNTSSGGTPTSSNTTPASPTPSAPAGNPALKGTIFTLGTLSGTPHLDMPLGSNTFTAALRTAVGSGTVSSLTSAITMPEDASNQAQAVAFDGATAYYLVGATIVGNGKTVALAGLSDTDATDLAVKGSTAYVTSAAQNCVYKVDLASGTTTIFAGAASNVGSFNDGPAADARFNGPAGITISGNTVYVADTYSRRIRAIAADGTTTTLAGAGIGSSDGVGTAAAFQGPTDVSADDKGNLYVADQNGNTVRKIVIADGTVTTIAGNGQQATKDGTGTGGSLFFPNTLAWGKSGGADILIVGQINHKIRLVSGW